MDKLRGKQSTSHDYRYSRTSVYL